MGEPPEGLGVDDAIPVLLKQCADGVAGLGHVPPGRFRYQLRSLGEGVSLYLFGSLPITVALHDAAQPTGDAGAGPGARRGKRAIEAMVMPSDWGPRWREPQPERAPSSRSKSHAMRG